MCYSQGNAQKYSILSQGLGKNMRQLDPINYAVEGAADNLMTKWFDPNTKVRAQQAADTERDARINYKNSLLTGAPPRAKQQPLAQNTNPAGSLLGS